MNKNNFFLLLLLIANSFYTYGQNFNEKFKELAQRNDTISQKNLLLEWKLKDAENPELYTAYFNYYVRKSTKESIALGKNPNGKETLVLTKEGDNSKTPQAYLYSKITYDSVDIKNAFHWITTGIKKFPNRLDMRFGKIYLLGKLENYSQFEDEIIQAIDYSAINTNQWTWTENELVKEPKKFFLDNLQSYQIQIYNTENDDLLPHMKSISERILKFYPDSIESLSNLSIVAMVQKEYDTAIEVLLKAEKLNPKDFVVLANLANAYRLKGDKTSAIHFYEKTKHYGDAETKEFAQAQINKLKAEQ